MGRVGWMMGGFLGGLLIAAMALAQPTVPGDCSGDRAVTVDEILTGVSIALGNRSVDECPNFDTNTDGLVTVDEIVRAVQIALGSLPTRTPTPTAPRTLTPTATTTRTPTATATPPILEAAFCHVFDSVPLLIPDDDVGGAAHELFVEEDVRIRDLNVELNLAHPFVGDLKASLIHVDSGTEVILFDRPGLPSLHPLGCHLADVLATIDDESPRPAELACGPRLPAMSGYLEPEESLAVFDDFTTRGTWRLKVADLRREAAGAVLYWCLDVNQQVPEVIEVTCNEQVFCEVGLFERFVFHFDFVDPDGDAVEWRIRGVRDDGAEFTAGRGDLNPPAYGRTLTAEFPGFPCDDRCRTTSYTFFVEVTDAQGNVSVPSTVQVTVRGNI